jgi:hypothetical protein
VGGPEDVGHPGVMSRVTSTSAVAACRARPDGVVEENLR